MLLSLFPNHKLQSFNYISPRNKIYTKNKVSSEAWMKQFEVIKSKKNRCVYFQLTSINNSDKTAANNRLNFNFLFKKTSKFTLTNCF